jgi:DNA-binding transcriptional LysR family regulator
MSGQTVLAFRTGCFYRSTLEHWFYQAGIIPGQVMELGTLDGIMSCVAAGMGITLLPRSVVEGHAARQDVRCHTLPAEFSRVKTVFIRNKDTVATPALIALIDLAHGQFAADAGVQTASSENVLASALACLDAA